MQDSTTHTVRTKNGDYILTIQTHNNGPTWNEVMNSSLAVIRSGQIQENISLTNNNILVSTIRIKKFNCLEWLLDCHQAFLKSIRSCRPPHFNKEITEDDISKLCREYSRLTVEEVHSNLKKMNTCYSEGKYGFNKNSLPLAVAVKCERQELWLFCRGRTIDRGYFSLVLNS